MDFIFKILVNIIIVFASSAVGCIIGPAFGGYIYDHHSKKKHPETAYSLFWTGVFSVCFYIICT